MTRRRWLGMVLAAAGVLVAVGAPVAWYVQRPAGTVGGRGGPALPPPPPPPQPPPAPVSRPHGGLVPVRPPARRPARLHRAQRPRRLGRAGQGRVLPAARAQAGRRGAG